MQKCPVILMIIKSGHFPLLVFFDILPFMFVKTYRFKLYHSKRNKKLHHQINIAGCIYNHCIALHKRYYRLYGKYLNKFKLQSHITKLKSKSRFAFWKQVGSQAIQELTERIDKGYQRFFDYAKKKTSQKASPPNFKKVKKYKSFTLKQAGWALEGQRIHLGKLYYGYFASRPIIGKIKTVTVKRDNCGDLFICFSVIVDSNQNLPMTGKIAGFDFGLLTFLTSSDTQEYEAPLFLKESFKALKSLQKALTRKVKGSNHRVQTTLQIAKLHRQIANQRKDYHFKLARELCSKYDLLFFEDLNIKAMQALWGRKISDLGFAAFLDILSAQALQYGKKLHRIDRFYASSKTCSHCGHKKKQLSLETRIFECESCSMQICRDKNAAINIERVGASTLGLDTVRPGISLGKCCLKPDLYP